MHLKPEKNEVYSLTIGIFPQISSRNVGMWLKLSGQLYLLSLGCRRLKTRWSSLTEEAVHGSPSSPESTKQTPRHQPLGRLASDDDHLQPVAHSWTNNPRAEVRASRKPGEAAKPNRRSRCLLILRLQSAFLPSWFVFLHEWNPLFILFRLLCLSIWLVACRPPLHLAVWIPSLLPRPTATSPLRSYGPVLVVLSAPDVLDDH